MRRLTLGLLVVCACGTTTAGDGTDASLTGDGPEPGDAPSAKRIRTIFVIPFENKANTQIYGNTDDAPYLNGLLTSQAAHATKFADALPTMPSEPHYIWMEAGTNAFTDHTFTGDADSSTGNSTASTEHLVTQLEAANIPWMSYQEGITSHTCPTASSNNYAAKHDPFVFFSDVVSSTRCADHHKSYADFAGDLANGLTGYVFITPDLCHDMHGAIACPTQFLDGPAINAGDTWLSQELPRIIEYTQTHDDAVIFVTWDEGDSTNVIPFLAIGNHVKGGHTSTVAYSHSSLLKSIELLLGVPVLSSVTSANDFADLFEDGLFN